jgi:hypothetical protein
MALKRKKYAISEKVTVVQEVERSPSVSQIEITKCLALAVPSLSSIC